MRTCVTEAGATVLVLTAALFYPGITAAHSGADMEQDPCMRLAGEHMVHFSTYQPQYQLNDQYCTEIPQSRRHLPSHRLLDPALRNEPIGMRVIRGNDKNETEGEIVADVYPSFYPDGVMRGEIQLDEGLYTVIIEAENRGFYDGGSICCGSTWLITKS